ncbi:MAG TPA: hypothetical protein VFP55_00730 [Solirubrobacteraceae bacterium]|nr:hypothetical protein [Solirubrobacteraceae bacterium]
MSDRHSRRVRQLLEEAARAHAQLIDRLPEEISESIPVDAQGLTAAIDYLAGEAGFSAEERRALIRPHGVNPAVLHARVFGTAPLGRGTVIGAFIDGARVRADALSALADAVGGAGLGQAVRRLLSESPLPGEAGSEQAVEALRAAYSAHEQAAILVARRLDFGQDL